MSATATKTTSPEAHRSSVIAVLALAEKPLSLDQVAKLAGLELTHALKTLARLLVEAWVETVSLEATCDACGQSRGRRTRYQLREERRA
jgi:predicted ArsR family transcriptional regulator